MHNTGLKKPELDEIAKVLDMGLNTASISITDILGKKTNVNLKDAELTSAEKTNTAAYIGGLILSAEFDGGLTGKASIIFSKNDIQGILGLLISGNSDNGEFEYDDITLETAKGILGKIFEGIANAASNYFEKRVDVKRIDVKSYDNLDTLADVMRCTVLDMIGSFSCSIKVGNQLDNNFELFVSCDVIKHLNGGTAKSDASDTDAKKSDKHDNGETAESDGGKFVSSTDEQYNQVLENGKSKEGKFSLKSTVFPDFSHSDKISKTDADNNVSLLMDVNMDVNIQLGHTKAALREIMNYSKGTLITLEKQAGAPVDVVVNGKLVARGDVVVIDDNFGVRLTEIVGDNNFLLKKFK